VWSYLKALLDSLDAYKQNDVSDEWQNICSGGGPFSAQDVKSITANQSDFPGQNPVSFPETET
jgi:hypothetical protein